MAAMPILRYLSRIVVFRLSLSIASAVRAHGRATHHSSTIRYSTVARVQSGWSSTKTVQLGGSAPFTAIIKLGGDVTPRVFNTSDAPRVDEEMRNVSFGHQIKGERERNPLKTCVPLVRRPGTHEAN